MAVLTCTKPGIIINWHESKLPEPKVITLARSIEIALNVAAAKCY